VRLDGFRKALRNPAGTHDPPAEWWCGSGIRDPGHRE
jgi:hypothetical protein